MQYKDLKEMTIKEWDGKPFYAIVNDDEEETLSIMDESRYTGTSKGCLVTGYDNQKWCCEKINLQWKHAYPLEWNKMSRKRMTNRQLAIWLAKGNGEYTRVGHIGVSHDFCYEKCTTDSIVDDDVRVRKWDSEEWIEPTTDLLDADESKI